MELATSFSVALDNLDLGALGVVSEAVSVKVLRLDQYMPDMSGNKYFKLKHNLAKATASGAEQIVSFGGAYSNHLHALALAGRRYGFKTVGLVRGEIAEPMNPTLADASAAGMQLVALTRSQYRQRHDQDFLVQLQRRWPRALIVPEGGSNAEGVLGCGDIVDLLDDQLKSDYDIITLPCGTGATLAGIASRLEPGRSVIGFAALKDQGALDKDVIDFQAMVGASNTRWSIERRYHFGGYAKVNAHLIQFAESFRKATTIELDPVYNAKSFYGLLSEIKRGAFAPGTRIVAIHTGGLQGVRGMREKIDQFVSQR